MHQHSPLADGDFRLVTILSGNFHDPISLILSHASLPDQGAAGNDQSHLSIKEIRATLPMGWKAFENLEGRVLYVGPRGTTWDHPHSVKRKPKRPLPSYEALSYAWGSEKDLDSVLVVDQARQETVGNGQQTPITMPIRRNLAEALRHLRYQSRPRVMWIDAICIDQTNMIERGSQVAFYGLAHRVIAWLGPESQDSHLALSTLEYLGQQVQYTKDAYHFPQPSYAEPDCVEPNYHRSDHPLPYSTEIWTAFQNLWSRSWFKRLWVLQEIHLSGPDSVMKCGDDEILWSSFRRAIICICNKESGVPEGPYMSSRSLLKMCGYAQADPFELLIWKHHNRQCMDDRDRIYGLMSLAPPSISRSLSVDYQLPPWDVYKQVVLAYLAGVNRLSFLLHCSIQSTATWDGPSWVPNWTKELVQTNIYNIALGASNASAAWATYSAPNKLSIGGIRIASIKSVESLQFKSFADLVKYMRIYTRDLEKAQYPTGETQLDGLIWNLTCGKLKDRAPERPSPTLETLRGVLLAAASSDIEADNALSSENLSSAFQLELLYTFSMCFLFFTSEGYSGISRSQVQPGDEVYIIPGCEVPMALRPTADGPHRVVGDCFVHGIMDGEAVLGRFPPNWKLIAKTSGGAVLPHYLNTKNGVVTNADPRLDEIPLPEIWEPVEFERTREDPKSCRKYRNRETGDVINSDPRLFHDALKARGIDIGLVTVI
ncbi:hypothetical protein NUW58_g1169 [Xylaria curta]|uniref:Uncharacterized protein n=1 Tax=Xylaria curta TaxID=42375 RepID=A0ACC1PME1_9PEZI|nr:hypothetical protein NUW58_g1169 [Xylaria curta]